MLQGLTCDACTSIFVRVGGQVSVRSLPRVLLRATFNSFLASDRNTTQAQYLRGVRYPWVGIYMIAYARCDHRARVLACRLRGKSRPSAKCSDFRRSLWACTKQEPYGRMQLK